MVVKLSICIPILNIPLMMDVVHYGTLSLVTTVHRAPVQRQRTYCTDSIFNTRIKSNIRIHLIYLVDHKLYCLYFSRVSWFNHLNSCYTYIHLDLTESIFWIILFLLYLLSFLLIIKQNHIWRNKQNYNE